MNNSGAVAVIPVQGIGMVQQGDDLPDLIAAGLVSSEISLVAGDVVVVAQKVVSKAEGQLVDPATVPVTAAARELSARSGKPAEVAALILADTTSVMRAERGVVVVRNRHGHVLANAGIDASNVAEGKLLLWPRDPDASARAIRARLAADVPGGEIAVIISDSMGRAWRMGTVGTAIGCAGLLPVRDRCGEADLFGRVLQATRIGVADEIAAAASLVIGEGAEGIPVAIVRGATYDRSDDAGVAPLLRPVAEDMFL
ncbi:MAG: coenzyme F420-0:L-glutamate ligase [Pseudomonadota bacterium]